MSIPLVVTAHLSAPTIGLTRRPFMLDGPLSWAAAVTSPTPVPPITPTDCPDMDLPLQRWHEHGTWGWCTSQAAFEVTHHGATELRRKPATAAMSRYTTDRRHHLGLGPHKARDTVLSEEWIRSFTWHVLATDRDRLAFLLEHITHLGAHRGIGKGLVDRWQITPDRDPEAWRDRPMPTPGAPPAAYRAPYWHPTRKVQADVDEAPVGAGGHA